MVSESNSKRKKWEKGKNTNRRNMDEDERVNER